MAKKKARKFSTEFKLDAVRRMAEATSIVGLAEELGVRKVVTKGGDRRKVVTDEGGDDRRKGERWVTKGGDRQDVPHEPVCQGSKPWPL